MLPSELIDHAAPRPSVPEPGVTVAYGEYLARTGGCLGCHGPSLSGGHVPGTPPDFPPAANITPASEVAFWSEDNFIQAMRTGVTPAGRQLDPFMPWKEIAKLTDDELKALWMYLKSVPAKETGNR